MTGSLTNNAGAGIVQSVTGASFTSCGSTVTACGLPWSVSIAAGGPTTWTADIGNVCVDILWLATCRYAGTLSGGQYDETADTLVPAGSLAKAAGGALCPATITVGATFSVTPTDLDIS